MSPNPFESVIHKATGDVLRASGVEILQVNVGLRCNQACRHCHVSASPDRTEKMPWSVMEQVADAACECGCGLVDVTGGAPELHPDLPRFVRRLRASGLRVQVRTNLSALLEPGLESFPAFFRDWEVMLVASLPCYLEENVRAQRGPGVYERCVAAIRHLNDVGYGLHPGLRLDLVYNPGGACLPPGQQSLEEAYRRELRDRYGISFSNLLALANMPVGRYLELLKNNDEEDGYRRMLEQNFNPGTVDGLMCRHQISVAWDGMLYDCDFNLALGLPVGRGVPGRLQDFDPDRLAGRKIVTGPHCFGCTAGSGSSCGGALA